MSESIGNTKQRLLIYPGVGDLLVAQPMLQEPAFSRSVCMMMDVEKKGEDTGCMGLVLNKRLEDVSLKDIFADLPNAQDIPLFLGGPVECERLFVLHTLGSRFGQSVEILPGVRIGGEIEKIREYIETGGEVEGRMRFFIGYSGWDTQQLQNEIKEGFWAVTRLPSVTAIFGGYGVAYWRCIVELMGEDYRRWLLIPENPALN